MLVILITVVIVGIIFGSVFWAFIPFGDTEERAKVKTRVIRYGLESRWNDGRTLVVREGEFYYLYLKREGRKALEKRIPIQLVKVITIDDYDFPRLDIKQEIMRFPSGRVTVSRELYRLYIQKDRINRSFFLRG